jgi:CBS domain-containing protein
MQIYPETTIKKESRMLRAKDIMTSDIVSTQKNTPVYQAVNLMLEHGITGIPVVDENDGLLGILTEKDVLRLHNAPDFGQDHTVEDYMTQPAVFFDEEEDLVDICNCLIEQPFRRVPVTSKGKLVGIISRRDIIKCIVQLNAHSEKITEQPA